MSALPEREQTVALVLPGQGRLGARVEKAADGFLSLSLLGSSGSQGALSASDASVVFTTAGGVHRLNGSVRRNPLRRGTLRFDFDGPSRLVQRRQHVRVDYVTDVRLFVRSRGNDVVETNTLDLSGGGLAVRDSNRLWVGDIVAVSLDLEPGTQPLRATGTVMREKAAGAKGIRFDRISDAERQRLVHFIFDRQRRELQVMKGSG